MLIPFGTKAETLESLSKVLKHSIVLQQVRFTVKDWQFNKQRFIEKTQMELSNKYKKLIARSSACYEDTLTSSKAGCYKSISNIDSKNIKSIVDAVEDVIASFNENKLPENQVFLQPFLEDIDVSGVIFTREIDTMAPYYVINYDDESKRTDTVTSGNVSNLKTLIKFRDYPTKREKFKSIFDAVIEIERYLKCDFLDIEFALDSYGKVYIFQVRPIVHSYRELPDSSKVGHYLNKAHKKIIKLNKIHPYLYGNRTIFGVMPDWNPAEMIGIKPRPLALSLYEYLITDRTWAYQRDNYGYKNLRSFPLIISFLGLPYIDVRVCFNSFIPKGISDDLGSRLVNYYLECLETNRELHDKVEFEIVFSCYFLNADDKIKKLTEKNFSDDDIRLLKQVLLKLTNNIISHENSIFKEEISKIEQLKLRQKMILESSLTVLEKIYWLLEDCCRYGTLPFAGLARAAFIAVQMLQSLVGRGTISTEEYNQFIAALNTIAKQMAHDSFNFTREEFLSKYGHLRPGTYDILSARYDEMYDTYFKKGIKEQKEQPSFEFGTKTINELDRILRDEGITVSAQGLINFIKESIEWREYAKFVFTKSVSEVLNLIKLLFQKYGLSADDASFIDIHTLLQLYRTLDHRDLSRILKEESDRNRNFYEITKLIKMPYLIVAPDEIFEFDLEDGMPNFITLHRCQGEVVKYEELLISQITGKIILIPSADPGYDWIFSDNIAGLVTMYGGANSHMAIRAAELKIPSVIGAGEKNYNAWSKAAFLEIDCEKKQVKIVE